MQRETIRGLVSTIIPVYNRAKMVPKAVDSVLAQTYRPIEILLVDDGSTDETPYVLAQLAADNPDVIRVIHKENGGPGLARETGRLSARGEFIQYLDSDDWLLPRKFELQVQALRDHPECGIAYGKSRYVNEKGEVLMEPSKWTGRKMEYLFPALLIDRWWHTHTPLFRRTISDAAGPWPRHRPEDWDLEARIGALRPRLVYCDEVLSCQLVHQMSERVSTGSHNQYLLDEALFLPTLYESAVKAGVDRSSSEMKHFSRWSFSLARQLGEMGKKDTARDMVALAKRSSSGPLLAMTLYVTGAHILGWGLMNRLHRLVAGLIGRKAGKNTLPGAWDS